MLHAKPGSKDTDTSTGLREPSATPTLSVRTSWSGHQSSYQSSLASSSTPNSVITSNLYKNLPLTPPDRREQEAEQELLQVKSGAGSRATISDVPGEFPGGYPGCEKPIPEEFLGVKPEEKYDKHLETQQDVAAFLRSGCLRDKVMFGEEKKDPDSLNF